MSEWKLVPAEPTEDQIAELWRELNRRANPHFDHESTRHVYRAMLAAAPTVSAEPVAWCTPNEAADIRWLEGLRRCDLPDGAPLYLHPPAPAVAWQDISTAPKDGTEVLVTGLVCEKGPERWVSIAQYSACRWCDEYGTEIYQPTHWMPLPTPPKEDEK